MNRANEHYPLSEIEQEKVIAEITEHTRKILTALKIDFSSDHNTKETAERFAKMMVKDICRGRFSNKPDITTFPNIHNVDQCYVVGPITVRSTCSHHLVPIIGNAWVGIIPGEKLIGLSKISRLVDWIMGRPQIQEESTAQIADIIEQEINPLGVAVFVSAQHLCMTWRGIRDLGAFDNTSDLRGVFRTDPAARAEFFSMVNK